MTSTLLKTTAFILLSGFTTLYAQMGIVNDYKNGGQRFDAEKYKSDRDMQKTRELQQQHNSNSIGNSSSPSNSDSRPIYRDRQEEARQLRDAMGPERPTSAAITGQGRAELRDGVYEGNFQYGQLEGKGKLTYNNGDVYEGAFKAGKPEGYGVLTETDGTVYSGAFENGRKMGYATVTYRDGRKYVGGWNGLERDGDGVEYNSSGTVIKKGRWTMGNYEPAKYDERFPPTPATQLMPAWSVQDIQPIQKYKAKDVPEDGLHRYQFPNGDVFNGRWIKHKIAEGKYYWINGDSARVVFDTEKNVRSWFTYYFKKGGGVECSFTKGKMDDDIDYLFPNGDKFSIRNLSTYTPDAVINASYSFANQDSYYGPMLKGKPEGNGTYFFQNGWTYSGNFTNGKRQDKDARLSYTNDKYPSMHGRFENDELVPGTTYTDRPAYDPHAPDMYSGSGYR